MINKLWEVLNKPVNPQSKWYSDVEIKREDPVIIVEGPKDKLRIILGMVLGCEGSYFFEDFSLDPFEIAIDFEQGYISFFMKPDNHA
jgi:hypothetical protein